MDYAPLLRLLILLGLIAFGVIVLAFFGLAQALLETDRSHVSSLIAAIFLATTLHCVWQTLLISRELTATRRIARAVHGSAGKFRIVDGQVVTAEGVMLEPSILTRHIANLIEKSRAQGGRRLDQTLLLRSLADQLRNREKLGWFVAEALLRLALLGTAVGFIFMLVPIASLKSFDVETLRSALAGMSGGMAVALNVTVSGIGCALLLKLEYYLLNASVSELFHNITETTEVHVVSALERA
ncbi:MotA/TolQ/ExbB proton channel family protein [Microvirga sp. M2]|uniref:MotA/TolQ/ExbB proton channel family protein n=1 Tax=Microvirga sp. M2 TaxID=3073270 RepID=UPI0039C2E7F9